MGLVLHPSYIYHVDFCDRILFSAFLFPLVSFLLTNLNFAAVSLRNWKQFRLCQ